MTKCIVCHGDDIHVATVREELKVGKDVVYVSIQTLFVAFMKKNIAFCSVYFIHYYDTALAYLQQALAIRRRLAILAYAPRCLIWGISI